MARGLERWAAALACIACIACTIDDGGLSGRGPTAVPAGDAGPSAADAASPPGATDAGGVDAGATDGGARDSSPPDSVEPMPRPPPAPPDPPTAEVCNAADDDSDGVCDEGLIGCRVGIHRARNPRTGFRQYTDQLFEAGCCGYEADVTYNLFHVYADMHEGLVPLYRCSFLGERPVVTTDEGCEGRIAYGVERTLGFIAREPRCGAVPLYRFVDRATGRVVYAATEDARGWALRAGWEADGVSGHVWHGP